LVNAQLSTNKVYLVFAQVFPAVGLDHGFSAVESRLHVPTFASPCFDFDTSRLKFLD
jgi:hypothetical protein